MKIDNLGWFIWAPLLAMNATEIDKALLVIAIASGASILSHVNDSGFWLLSKYLGLDEKQTFKSWTVMTTILALLGFGTVLLLSLLSLKGITIKGIEEQKLL